MERLVNRVVFLAGSRCTWRPCSREASRLYRSLAPAPTATPSSLAPLSMSLVSRVAKTPPRSQSVITLREPRFIHASSQCRTADSRAQQKLEDATQKQSLSLGDRVIKFIGWMAGFYSRKAVLSRSALEIYKSCIDELDYEAFFKACKLPDSLHSWFLVAQLHIWLCMVRLKREGPDGQHIIRELVSTFWYDVKERPKALGVHSSSLVAKSLREMSAEFNGLTIAYEEGLLFDDKVLAAAIWRNLIHDKSATDPVQLEAVVQYIRRQVLHMDKVDSEELLRRGKISLLPFNPPPCSYNNS